MPTPTPTLIPLGDSALLVRFSERLDDTANRAAIALAHRLAGAELAGIREIVPNLVSVLLRFDPAVTDAGRLAGDVRLMPPEEAGEAPAGAASHVIEVDFDGEDLAGVAEMTGLDTAGFVAAHNGSQLRVLATGFAPGFVYCGFHPEPLHVPRRTAIRGSVPAGTVLFAAGQTALAATPIPTGWHVIGHTTFRNFDPGASPPTTLRAGDGIVFRALAP